MPRTIEYTTLADVRNAVAKLPRCETSTAEYTEADLHTIRCARIARNLAKPRREYEFVKGRFVEVHR